MQQLHTCTQCEEVKKRGDKKGKCDGAGVDEFASKPSCADIMQLPRRVHNHYTGYRQLIRWVFALQFACVLRAEACF